MVMGATGATISAKPMHASPKIALCEWSLHRELRRSPALHLELPKLAHEVFGVEGVAYQSSFFPDKATDFSYLAEMKKRADDAGVKAVLVEVVDAGGLGALDLDDRWLAIEQHFAWIAAAAFLGCDSVSVGAESFGSGAPYLEPMADSLRRLGKIAGEYGIDLLVGNRRGLACDGSWTAALMKKTAFPRVGTHVNSDNFELGGARVYPRYQGVQEMMPWAKALSLRSYDFDANGEETKIDFGRLGRIASDAGYAGWIGIEYDGPALPEREGISRTVALARRTFAGSVDAK